MRQTHCHYRGSTVQRGLYKLVLQEEKEILFPLLSRKIEKIPTVMKLFFYFRSVPKDISLFKRFPLFLGLIKLLLVYVVETL